MVNLTCHSPLPDNMTVLFLRSLFCMWTAGQSQQDAVIHIYSLLALVYMYNLSTAEQNVLC